MDKRFLVVSGLAVFLSVQASAHSIDAEDLKVLNATRMQKLPIELERLEEAKPPAGLAVRGVLDSLKLWPINKVITVCFMNGDVERKKLVVDAAKDWLDGLSVRMAFGSAPAYLSCTAKPDADMRVAFFPGGSWSYVGTDSLLTTLPRSDPTMNIGYGANKPLSVVDMRHLKATISHEIGHALGYEHEHQSPISKCDEELDWDYIFRTLVDPPDTTRATVERNFKRLVASPRFLQTAYDRSSIMHYALPPVFFKNQTAATCYVPTNFVLSNSDKQLAKMAYPRTQQERDAFLRRGTQVASAELAPTPMSSGELASFAGEVSKVYQRLGTSIALNFDFKSSTNIRDSGSVETQNCDQIISSSRPPAGVNCKIATDASYLSIGGP